MDETPGSISERQSPYLLALAQKKDLSSNRLNDQQRAYLLAGDYSAMSKAQASKAIELLLKLDDSLPAGSHGGSLPAGSHGGSLPAGSHGGSLPAGSHGGSLPAGSTSTEHSDDTTMQYGDSDYSPPNPVRVLENNARQMDVDNLTELEDKVDAGYYFVVNHSLIDGGRHDPNDGERFYHVSKPEPPSRWAGRTFIESRGGDYLYKVKDVKHRIAVLEEILKDPINAMNEYGIRLGVCGSCGRTLTAKDSRLRGLGPICAARILGAPTESQLAMLDQLGLRKR